MKAQIKNNMVIVTDSWLQKDVISSIPGRQWKPELKAWLLPLTKETLGTLIYIPGAQLSQDIKATWERMNRVERETEEEKLTENVEPVARMPVKAKPFMHQVRAFNIAVKLLGVME
jgi:hypothetical protein